MFRCVARLFFTLVLCSLLLLLLLRTSLFIFFVFRCTVATHNVLQYPVWQYPATLEAHWVCVWYETGHYRSILSKLTFVNLASVSFTTNNRGVKDLLESMRDDVGTRKYYHGNQHSSFLHPSNMFVTRSYIEAITYPLENEWAYHCFAWMTIQNFHREFFKYDFKL